MGFVHVTKQIYISIDISNGILFVNYLLYIISFKHIMWHIHVYIIMY